MGTPGSEDFSETVDVSFHGVPYLLTVSTINGETMCLEVEQKSDASRWRGDFTSRYIEDITAKTGNFKKFPVFVRMLLSAVKQASDSVFVDLLTYQDLEVLKARKAGAQAAAANKPLAPSNKRYLILTYAAEFDRVHYPLPLLFEENPDPQRLRTIISQLRAEVDTLRLEQGTDVGPGKRGAGNELPLDLRRLREENQTLRQQLKQLERATRVPQGGGDLPDSELARELKMVRKERDLLASRAEAQDAELERERGLHRRELRRKAKEVAEVADELARAKETIRELKLQIRQLTDELESNSRRLSSADRIKNTYGRPLGADYYHGGAGGGRSGSRPQSGGSARGVGSRGHSPSAGPGPGAPRHRDNSRGRETSSRERGASPSSSRPNSAPAARSGPRFDPTEYIRQQRERQEMAGRRSSGGGSSRAPTPPRSQASSGRSSPAASRPTSADRRGLSPMSSRPTSAERSRPQPWGAGAGARAADRVGRGLTVDVAASKSRGSSPGSGRGGAWEPREAWSKFPAGSGAAAAEPLGARRSGGSRPQSAERATSPGRALQEVKRKLGEYVTKRSGDSVTASAVSAAAAGPGGGSTAAAGAGLAAQSSKSQLFEDASAEIADIDTRLHALQNFLRMAKSSAAATGSVASGSAV